jgi:DNA transformation protein
VPPERRRRRTAPDGRGATADPSAVASAVAALARLRNLGPYSARLLVAAGVRSPGALRALGAAAAFRRVLFQREGRVSTNLLWALEGALRGERWDRLDAATRARLRAEVDRGDEE